jgi:uncharacterized cofD-like protein
MSAAKRAVAIGGGTGLPRGLHCLLDLGCETTAVVTVADDGGSSGALRREFGILPPGDARNCLVAMADPHSPFARVFQYRFEGGGELAGHALGNLIIAALVDIEGDFASALATAGKLLGAHGRVLPSTLEDIVLLAEIGEGLFIEGQAAAANSELPLCRVHLDPEDPPAYRPALDAVREADVALVGPGSLYTSIMPNFLVAGMAEALRVCSGRRVYLCNVANQRGETYGMDAADHVRALLDHGLEGAFDVVLLHDTDAFPPEYPPSVSKAEVVVGGEPQRDAVVGMGLEVVGADLIDPSDPRHHDRAKLLAALRGVL